MKDDDTGIDPVATDGEPDVSEIERRRQAKEKAAGGSMSERALASEQAALDADDGKGEPVIDEADDGQFFVWEQGRKVTLGTLIARGTPVEHAFVFGGKRTKGQGGLMGFDADVFSVVRFLPGPVRIVPTRDDDEKVTKVTIENHVTAKVVANANSDEGVAMISHILEARGWALSAPAKTAAGG